MEKDVASFGEKISSLRGPNLKYLEDMYLSMTGRVYIDNAETIKVTEKIKSTDQFLQIIAHSDFHQYGPSKWGVLLAAIYLNDCEPELDIDHQLRYELRVHRGSIELFKRVVSENTISKELCSDLEVNNLVYAIKQADIFRHDP